MTLSDVTKIIFNLVFLFFAQIFFFKFGIFGIGFCFPYVFFLMLLPMSMSNNLLLFVGFAYGLLIDVFYDSPGLHAAACTLLTYLRPHVISSITPSGGYDEHTPISVHILGFRWILLYALLLVSAHHALLFFLEVFSFNGFFLTLLKVVVSSLLTTLVFIMFQYLSSYRKLN